MPSVILVGAQWGDEGKGKILDILSNTANHLVKAQGGNNAGHTIHLGSSSLKLCLIPTGILYPHTQCYIGAGTVIDPQVLINEIESLQQGEINVKNRLWISSAAHVIFPYHKQIDILLEQRKGVRSIGTTGRGIGPCYADKANRLGIRIGELIRPDIFPRLLKDVLAIKNEELTKLYGAEKIDYQALLDEYAAYANLIEPYVSDVEEHVHDLLAEDEYVLFEAAQGTFLDLTTGTYPFVTSSHTTAGGVCTGAGIGPTRIDHTLGVIKAYTSRVGNGPLPTVMQEGDLLSISQSQDPGASFGRKRRIGWFDGVMAKTAVRLNGLDSLAVTSLDVLDRCPKIKLCVAYEIRGSRCNHLPTVIEDWDSITPIYEEFLGWQTPTSDANSFEELPPQARRYLQRIEELCEVPISIISLGPERHKTIIQFDIFNRETAPLS